jgi:hypothetical protein
VATLKDITNNALGLNQFHVSLNVLCLSEAKGMVIIMGLIHILRDGILYDIVKYVT